MRPSLMGFWDNDFSKWVASGGNRDTATTLEANRGRIICALEGHLVCLVTGRHR